MPRVQWVAKGSANSPCCCCPAADLSAVIAGPDPCFVACLPVTPDSPPGGFEITTPDGFDISGGVDLTYIAPFSPGDPARYDNISISIFTVLAYAAGCPFPEIPTEGRLALRVFCNATPNDDGKKFGLWLTIDTVVPTYLADLQTDPANWFNLDEEVELDTPCGTYTLMIPSAA